MFSSLVASLTPSIGYRKVNEMQKAAKVAIAIAIAWAAIMSIRSLSIICSSVSLGGSLIISGSPGST